MAKAEYNFFKLNGFGLIDTANRLRFSDDGSAAEHARGMYHPGRVEVWAGKRRVCVVPAAIARRAVERRSP